LNKSSRSGVFNLLNVEICPKNVAKRIVFIKLPAISLPAKGAARQPTIRKNFANPKNPDSYP